MCDLEASKVEAEWLTDYNTHEGKKVILEEKHGQPTNSNASHGSNNKSFEGKNQQLLRDQAPQVRNPSVSVYTKLSIA